MKKSLNFLIAGVMTVYTSAALAHGRWIVPSHTILSGEQAEVVTFDISISNDIFHPDWAIGGIKPGLDKAPVADNPRAKIMAELMGSTRVQVTSPDGSVDNKAPLVNFVRKSVSMAKLAESGTYKVSVTQNPVYLTFYENAEGERAREFGTPQEIKPLLPEGAKNVNGLKLNNRISTYVTRNDVSRKAIAPAANGLDLKFVTHPNELFAGEEAEFIFYLHGKPVTQAVSARFTRNDTRFRNERKSLQLNSTKNGTMKVTWPDAGLYLMEAEVEQKPDEPLVGKEVFALYITFEVNPE